ncbi:MAG: efflux system, rane fusion protein CmeA [Myxococcaceae bacterium]|nr:efflux system, rane fusion protein CmeA [Myxococcaceae bacterium]
MAAALESMRATLMCCGMAMAVVACGSEHKAPPPPPLVSVAPVTERDVPIYVEFSGTLDAQVNAEVRARVAGVLLAQNYREGSIVKTGQLLFTIDALPFRAALLQARGSLEQARAALAKAEADIARYRPLVEKRAATKEQLDNALAARLAALGQVEGAEGALHQAELNLGYTRVLSPIDGLADIAQVRVGNLVGQQSPTLLTTVSTIDTMRLVFQISEVAYLEYAERIKQLSARTPAEQASSDDPTQKLELVLAGGRVYPQRGYIAIVGRQIDPTTGTLTVQAFFPNPDLLLRPGQYGHARFMNTLTHAVVVPQRAVRELQGQNLVAVVGPDNHVDMRRVDVGPVSGAFIVVKQGVKPGERVVVEGIQKTKAGQPVTVMPADTSTLELSSAPVAVRQGEAPAPTSNAAPGDAGPNGAGPSDAATPR